MKIQRIVLWASLLFATSMTSALSAQSSPPLNSVVEKAGSVKDNNPWGGDAWMYLSIGAILIVLLVLIILIFWTRRRGKKKS